MSITKQFEETFYLGFEDLGLSKKLSCADILFSDNILARLESDRVTFHCLTSSDQIVIPGVYINLFLGIDRLMGDKLKSPKTGLEELLFIGSRLVRMIYGGDKTGVHSLLSRAISIGTVDLRRLLKSKFDYHIDPWTIRNINNSIEI